MPPLAGDAAAACAPPPPRPAPSIAEPCARACDDGDAAERFLSHEALAREPHSLRALAPLLQLPGVIWLAGGTPHGSTFPFVKFSATLRDGTVLEMNGDEAYECQQYCMNSAGYPPLVDWVTRHAAAVHAPPRRTAHLVTSGNTCAIDLVLRTLLNRGDCALVEEFTYSATLQAMRPLGLELLGVRSDAEGPCPAALRAALLARRQGGLPAPKLFYAVPVSCNPTGVSWSEARKAAVYALACEFDFLILEDDAYYYLRFPRPGAPPPGIAGLGRSLLARDVQGRVVRADTFAKFVAPGLRLGWLTAPPAVAERLLRCMQASAQGACSQSQVLAARLLSAWGDAGLSAHVTGLQREYARRAEALMAAAERHLGGTANGGTPLATWTPPGAGMFLWMRLGCGVEDAEALQAQLAAFKVVAVPGKFFSVSGSPTPQVRLSFASATDAQFDAGMARLASLLRSLPGAPQPEGLPTPDKAAEPPAAAATSSDEQDDTDGV